jgi:hypothetical protein
VELESGVRFWPGKVKILLKFKGGGPMVVATVDLAQYLQHLQGSHENLDHAQIEAPIAQSHFRRSELLAMGA